jgi:ABC-2 type transport system permease protein
MVRVSLAVAMQYREDFLLDGVTGLFRAVAAIAPIALVFSHRDQILGWSEPQVVLVIGLYFLMQAVLAGLVEPNLGEIVEAIRSGNLDLMLLKPADSQILASVRRVAPSHVWDLLVAGALIAYAYVHMPVPAPIDVVLAVLMLLCGLAAMYGLWLLAICASFFFVRVDNLRFLLWSVTDAGRWPLDVFARWIQFVLIAVIPIGLLTTFPVMALSGAWTMPMVLAGLAVAAVFLVGSRLAWNRSLASYTSASS